MQERGLTTQSSRALRCAELSRCAATPWDQPRVKAQACVHRSRPAELSLHGHGHFGSRANIASRTQARLLLSPASFRKRAESVLIRKESATGSDARRVIQIGRASCRERGEVSVGAVGRVIATQTWYEHTA